MVKRYRDPQFGYTDDDTRHKKEHDPVNHPTHYTFGGIETIQYIEAKELDYHLGNAVKYISRAKFKDNALQDIEKAVFYLNRYLKIHKDKT